MRQAIIYNIAERLDSLEEPFKMDVEREVHFLSRGGGGKIGEGVGVNRVRRKK